MTVLSAEEAIQKNLEDKAFQARKDAGIAIAKAAACAGEAEYMSKRAGQVEAGCLWGEMQKKLCNWRDL